MSASHSHNQRGMLLVISGPSGVGKTTITHHVEEQLGGVFSVSMTTRARAETDREGIDYHFVDMPTFVKARDGGELLEWAEVYPGLCYGTPRRPVEEALAAGRLMILEIDVDGALQVKEKLPDAYALFVLPPSERVLLERLRHRGRDDEAAIQRRFAKAKREIIKAWDSGVYDEFIVNRDLDRAVAEAVELVRMEMSRRR
jgi:guanylate kinase